jgi:hypothetical protein
MTKEAVNMTTNLEIMNRLEIDAPPGYVSVYHETTTETLQSINTNGLTASLENRNLGSSSEVQALNELIDRDRPDRFIALGVSRVHNIFAYYSLESGFSLGFAARRYVRQPQVMLKQTYQALAEHDSNALATMNVQSFEEYERTIRDPLYLKKEYPGEVLELKVDPLHTFVADLGLYTDIAYDVKVQGRKYETGDATNYWGSVVTLDDFRKWYSRPLEASDNRSPYLKKQNAPSGLPDQITSPEILIPSVVLPTYIRVLP